MNKLIELEINEWYSAKYRIESNIKTLKKCVVSLKKGKDMLNRHYNNIMDMKNEVYENTGLDTIFNVSNLMDKLIIGYLNKNCKYDYVFSLTSSDYDTKNPKQFIKKMEHIIYDELSYTYTSVNNTIDNTIHSLNEAIDRLEQLKGELKDVTKENTSKDL